MGKSSSSSKKIKRSKDLSELRSVQKKKTKRSKSKKVRRIKDYSDESESDSSLYSSSSEDDYRREKRRSKVSKIKKRSRKRYSSSESDDYDDDIRPLKKTNKSKRKDERVETKKKKKIVSRKRRKRDSTSSSTSTDSYSIGDNQTDDVSESDGKTRTGEKRRLGMVKDESEEESEHDECWQVEDEVMTEKNSRRLKSIVVVSYNYDNDEREKDMVDDHGGESDEKKIVDDQRDGEVTISYPRTIGYEEYDSFETSKASHQDDDLEAILKKRALENLIRFRGETPKNGIARKEVSSVSEEETESENFETSQKILQVVNVKESGSGLADLASQQPGDTAKVKASSGISSCTTKRKLIRPVLRQESLNMVSREESAGCQGAEAENINGKSCPESSSNKGGENIEPRKVSSTSSSHAETETETLDENKVESQSEQKTNDESQYEKKTMTVMRGGEMVQVKFSENYCSQGYCSQLQHAPNIVYEGREHYAHPFDPWANCTEQ